MPGSTQKQLGGISEHDKFSEDMLNYLFVHNNVITGQAITSGHSEVAKGMVNDHLGVGGVKPPGYTTHDTT